MDFFKIFISETTSVIALEILFRCIVMYLLIILVLRFCGKRGIRQLSIFEICIILSLGSAAGDPMFDQNFPIVHAALVFIVILTLYRFTTYLMMKFNAIENLLEGRPIYIVKEGLLILEDIKKEKYSYDEFFSELRQNKIEHLGQVKIALLETEGTLSVIGFNSEDISWGLPIFPDQYKEAKNFKATAYYSCMICAETRHIENLKETCPRCQCQKWARSQR